MFGKKEPKVKTKIIALPMIVRLKRVVCGRDSFSQRVGAVFVHSQLGSSGCHELLRVAQLHDCARCGIAEDLVELQTPLCRWLWHLLKKLLNNGTMF